MIKLTKTHILLVILQVLIVVNIFVNITNRNWFDIGIAVGLLIIFMPTKDNVQAYSIKTTNILKNKQQITNKLRLLGLFILLASLLIDLGLR